MNLPVSFEKSMRNYLGESWADFEQSYDQPGFFGIRYNPLKISKEQFIACSPVSLEEVPWCRTGFYYDGEQEQPAKHPYYHAGLYYIQEPSAMLPATLLPIEPGDKVLDLCAAPGGKSTQIAGRLQGKGLLVSNDISVSRARALVKNLEMAGVTNAVVTSEKPRKLAGALPGFFDKILVDAPCSGEGMFRRNPQMVKDYAEHGPSYYAELQKEILSEAVKMLKPGGYLLYSTCTFSPEEDEKTAEWIMKRHPFLKICDRFSFDGRGRGMPEWIGSDDDSLKKAYRMWPHKIKGEGHFAVLFQKTEGQAGSFRVRKKSKNLTDEAERFLRTVHVDDRSGVYEEIAGKLYLVPNDMPELKGIRMVRSGLYLGDIKKKRFEPSQALAMALKAEQYENCIHLPLDDKRVIKYLKCETIPLDGPDGIVLICVDDFPLGWGKLKNGILKNKYAASWRWV
ncbi:MAG: RsmB/NOP family class I SAM-dependent RNA methyltransferase [Lachnospiraceae bacterium]|nr:RsmB/NOP family class I SAM-dependent RNA methyltransferase [Lachnospiraceae bacterium]